MVQVGLFDWKRHPEAERFVTELAGAFLKANRWAADFAEKLEKKTGTRFLDWIDHIVVPDSGDVRIRLAEFGFTRDAVAETPPDTYAFSHAGAIFPAILLRKRAGGPALEVALKPESVAAFAAVHGAAHEVEGEEFSRYRRVVVSEDKDTRLLAVERRAYKGYLLETPPPEYYTAYSSAEERWRTRNRWPDDEEAGFRETGRIIDYMISRVGRDLAGYIIFDVERQYWLGRNLAGRVQKRRQDALGLGWGNHDHHTFRCSRRYMPNLIRILEKLGFVCRERFYAGEEAGWGAQVMEHAVLQITVFTDLDLTPREIAVDFAHNPLPMVDELGTVGLWVGLHGESFFQAGLHHVAGRFDFERLREDLTGEGINTMKPFSYFDFLKQAFTEGEVWQVIPERAKELLRNGSITDRQYRKFIKEGARGSHLENLERKEGFKGFNQESVSAIIQATDPRR